VRLGAAITGRASSAPVQKPIAGGLGSIEQSRGGLHVDVTCNGADATLQGEMDTHCEPWIATGWVNSAWTGDAWTGSTWTADAWTGSTWTGSTWTGSTWTGGSWQGTASWTGSTWTGSTWTGSTWTGSTWTGSTWTGNSWTGDGWAGALYDGSFLTAFWGGHPVYWQRLPGERSSAPPWALTGRSAQ
jgi:hypothetical protein